MAKSIKELIEEIQNEAVGSNCDLGSLLRKCKLLAMQLGSKPLEDWLIWESNGYPDNLEVPDYRRWSLELRGTFTGYAGARMNNAPIPISYLPEDVREPYLNYQCRQSISSIEETIHTNSDSSFKISALDLAVYIGMDLYENYNCLHAWAVLPRGNILELLNSVRNRILDFVISIGKEQFLEEPYNKKLQPSESSRVTHIFNTHIYGGAGNIVGMPHNTSVEINIVTGDFNSLSKELKELGVQQTDIDDLEKALQQDGKPTEKGSHGRNVSKWKSKMIEKAADGSWKVGLSAAGNLLATAISKYYGW